MATKAKAKAGKPKVANDRAKSIPDSRVHGSLGLREYGGYIVEEYVRELRGPKGAEKYAEIVNSDPVAGGVLMAITNLVKNANWSVTEADESDAADEAKRFVEEVLFEDMSTSFESTIEEICSMFQYGFAPFEILWKIRRGPDEADSSFRSKFTDGRVGIRRLALRAQNTIQRWDFDQEDGGVKGLWQQPFSKGLVQIPIEKLLLFRTVESKGNPEGRSLLRSAYRSWYFKTKIEELEAIGIERDLAGMPVMLVPGTLMLRDADPEQKAAYENYKRLVNGIKRDTNDGIVMPSDRDASGNLKFELKLLSTAGSRQFPTNDVIMRHGKAMAMSVLADFLFLGQQSVGSFALSSDKTALFATAIGAFMKSIAAVFNRILLPRLWRFNGLPPETMPKLVPGDIESPDLGELGSFLQSLATAGMPLFPNRDLENALMEMAGLPLMPEEEDIETPPVPVVGPGAAPPGNDNADPQDPKAQKDPKAAAAADVKKALGRIEQAYPSLNLDELAVEIQKRKALPAPALAE